MSNSLYPDALDLKRAKQAWSLRVRRIGSLIQGGLAGFWLVRGAIATSLWWRYDLAWICALVSMAFIMIGTAATRGRAGRPPGEYARHLEQKINIATLIQLVASFVLPAVVEAYGRADLILPAVVVSVGPLLMYFWFLLGIRRHGFVGLVLTVGPLLLATVLHGDTLTAVTGLSAGFLALSTSTLNLRDVAAAAL